LIGGAHPLRPGEATLAHCGVLYLDELTEFRRDALEALQAPLVSGEVTISGAVTQRTLPSRFMLVAAANPCPCGRGESDPDCSCAPYEIQRFQTKLRSALAERIDIFAAVRQPTPAEIGGAPGESSATVRERVCAAREIQERRLGPGRCNAQMTTVEARACALSDEGAALLADLYARQRLSGRAHDGLLRLAQTLADLAGLDEIGEDQMAQALRMGRPR
jgi:magnesium chelatase family protein